MEDFVLKLKAARAAMVDYIRFYAQEAGADLTGSLDQRIVMENADRMANFMVDLQNLNNLIKKYDR
ncbi:MAG: hypothetical protein GF409_00595 [Candidatus Omnitrophica bacterium]|nr:hypothetical protein [Candidatus Omnitrophota bacterium]